MTKVAAIQMASGPNVSANLSEAARLIQDAAKAGAKLVVLPENFALMGMKESDTLTIAEDDGSGPIQDFLAEQAAKHRIWLVGGTLPIKGNSADRVRAACCLYDDKGQRVARYDKIHLFDVTLEEDENTYHESATFEPGDSVVVVETPFGKLGLSICYDLRFPELFRRMVDLGMEILVVPSAFTSVTGRAHWEPLLRARAIENLCYVIAPDQGGYHVNGRETHGDSMVIDPWGIIIDRLLRGSGIVVADIDHQKLADNRRNFPVLEHKRLPCYLND